MESIIYKYLREKLNTENILAKYGEFPAIFNTIVPADEDENWSDKQYPRLVFELNMQADPERKVSGQLFIDVMCENNVDSIRPENIAAIVKPEVDGCFFSTEDLTISAQWRSADDFAEKDRKLSGITLVFDILAYPKQLTTTPDPVLAVNEWLKTLYPDAYVIGKDVLPSTWKPTDTSPALYCRLSNLGKGRMESTAAVTWVGATMHINIMAPSEVTRSVIAKNSIQFLFNATRLILDDNSPMLIDSVTDNMAADPLREGQIQIKGTYGVLNTYTGTPLNHAYISSGVKYTALVNEKNNIMTDELCDILTV